MVLRVNYIMKQKKKCGWKWVQIAITFERRKAEYVYRDTGRLTVWGWKDKYGLFLWVVIAQGTGDKIITYAVLSRGYFQFLMGEE